MHVMESNLARELETEKLLEESQYAQEHVEQVPVHEPELEELAVPTGISRFEKTLILGISIILFGLLLLNVSSNLDLTTTSREVEDLGSQIQTTENEVENLEQHIHELSRYDRVHEIAEKYGLELHEENIHNLSLIE